MDYHKNFDDYFAAKRRLFDGTGAGTPDASIINIDDEYGKRLAGHAKNVITYGLDASAQISTKKFQLTFSGLSFMAQTPKGKVQIVVAARRPHQRLQPAGSDRRGAGARIFPTRRLRRVFRIWRAFLADFSGSIWDSPFLWLSITRTPTTRSKT